MSGPLLSPDWWLRALRGVFPVVSWRFLLLASDRGASDVGSANLPASRTASSATRAAKAARASSSAEAAADGAPPTAAHTGSTNAIGHAEVFIDASAGPVVRFLGGSFRRRRLRDFGRGICQREGLVQMPPRCTEAALRPISDVPFVVLDVLGGF